MNPAICSLDEYPIVAVNIWHYIRVCNIHFANYFRIVKITGAGLEHYPSLRLSYYVAQDATLGNVSVYDDDQRKIITLNSKEWEILALVDLRKRELTLYKDNL